MSAKEIGEALSSVFVRGILDWKMPFFRACLYAIAPALTAIYAGLQDYKLMTDVDELTWFKIKISAGVAAISGLTAFLDSTFTRTKDRLKERSSNEKDSIADSVASHRP